MSRGGAPKQALYARLNAASEAYPTRSATSLTLIDPPLNISDAKCKRHLVRYRSGASPTVIEKWSAKLDLDIEAIEASSGTVHAL